MKQSFLKLTVFVFAVVLLLALASCNNTSDNDTTTPADTTMPNETTTPEPVEPENTTPEDVEPEDTTPEEREVWLPYFSIDYSPRIHTYSYEYDEYGNVIDGPFGLAASRADTVLQALLGAGCGLVCYPIAKGVLRTGFRGAAFINYSILTGKEIPRGALYDITPLCRCAVVVDCGEILTVIECKLSDFGYALREYYGRELRALTEDIGLYLCKLAINCKGDGQERLALRKRPLSDFGNSLGNYYAFKIVTAEEGLRADLGNARGELYACDTEVLEGLIADFQKAAVIVKRQ